MQAPEPYPFANDAIALVFQNTAPDQRAALLYLRNLIFDTAKTLDVGPINESLKWGQPSYVPGAPKTGTAVRLGCPEPGQVGMYVHCQTSIVGALGTALPADIKLDGNRGLIFTTPLDIAPEVTVALIRAAFTYYR